MSRIWIMLFALVMATMFINVQASHFTSYDEAVAEERLNSNADADNDGDAAMTEEATDADSDKGAEAFELYVPNKNEAAEIMDKEASIAGIDDFELTGSRRSFEYVCPPGSALSYMYSEDRNNVHDRHWRFGCRKISNKYIDEGCSWSRNHNFDQPMQGMCATGYAVTGFRSLRYSPGHRDRQYNVRCCKSDQVETCCRTTDFINNWDAKLDFRAPANKIIAGIYSEHLNAREDRRFKVKICDVKKAFYDCSC